MKILMLTPYLPYPLYSGGQIRSYNLLKNLAKKHEITLFSFIRSAKEKKYLPQLRPYCRQVRMFTRRPAWDPRNLLLALLTPYPFLVSIYLSRHFRQAIAAELKNGYDLIHAETFYILPNLPRTETPTLLVEQTIEYLVYQQFVRDYKFWPVKPLLYFDVFKINLWEKYYWRLATRLAAMSDSDRQMMNRSVKDKKVDVVANGVDAEFFSRVQPNSGQTVLFIGNFKWLPNRDAAQFLVREIWPEIIRRLPAARLLIVGRNPTPEILKLGQTPQVTVDGNVSDIRRALAKASVLLAPIRNGRGTKYKVLEAMASGLPVVTTKLGIEGIEAKNSVLVAESARELAVKTVQVLTNRRLAGRLAAAAKKIVYERYNWTAISDRLNLIYQQLGGA